ncbi:MAG: BLUF domain-containing protein [Bryobacteraceae bacterium]
MFYLIYTSSATRLLTADELQGIHSDAMEGNARRGVTGFLLYRGGNFMQLLEGEEQTVRALFERIMADGRHKDVYVIKEGTRPDRIFRKWAMGFVDMDKMPGMETYQEFMNESLDSLRFRQDGKLALRFLESFNQMSA